MEGRKTWKISNISRKILRMATPKTPWISLILMSRSIKNALATTQSNERNPSRSRSKFLHLLPLVSPFLSPRFTHGRTKDGPIARFIATLKRTYLLWSRCSRGKSSWPLNFETSLRVQARIGRNRCTSFPNAPTHLPPPRPPISLCI